MNKIAKLTLGWVIWTVGVIVYATLSTEIDLELPGTTALEAAHTMMMAAYFFGVPIMTAIWMFGVPE